MGQNSRKTKRSKQRQSNIPRTLVDLGLSGSRADDHLVLADLTYRPPSSVYKARPPRNLLNQIYFVRQETASSIAVSATGTNEANWFFTANIDMANASSYLSIFDQYMLHAVTFTVSNPRQPTNGTDLPFFFSALDFDGVPNISTLAAIEAYSTVNSEPLGPGKSVTRVITPVSSVSALPSGNNVTRMWVNTNSPNVQFNGIRTMTVSSVALSLDVTIGLIWAFRNTS